MTTTIKILPTPLEILEAAYVVCGVLMEKRQAPIMLCSLTSPKAGVRDLSQSKLKYSEQEEEREKIELENLLRGFPWQISSFSVSVRPQNVEWPHTE